MPATIAEIRCATASEREALGELHRRSSYFWEEDRANLEAHPDALGVAPEAIADDRVRVAVGQLGELLGFSVVAHARGGVCILDDLFVEPAVMRQGIGYAIAERAGAEGMTVALVDIDEAALEQARTALASKGVVVHAVAADVSDRAAMMRLRERVAHEIGDVWLLVNNAGVFLAGPFLEMSAEQCEFLVGVNLWGVVHGLHAFLPEMVARDGGYVVNTSSVDGIVTVPNAALYVAAKHAVTALSETLYRELDAAGSKVGVSVLCPGAVATNIVNSARHWPERLGRPPEIHDCEYPQLDQVMRPPEVADITFEAIAERRFWILTHPEQYAPAMRARMARAIEGANPDDTTVDPNFRAETGRVPA